MGPHFFKCGKRFSRERRRLRDERFNGAALFQVRKVENCSNDRGECFAVLQWGRTFSSAESAMLTMHADSMRRCFNGAALFQVRKGGLPAEFLWDAKELQWGRTFSSAERTSIPDRLGKLKPASMGPHFFKCGKTFCFRSTPCQSMQCFNGAALFQVRKVGVEGSGLHKVYKRFNGAALFQVRKERSLYSPTKSLLALQWGRTFSSAESAGRLAYTRPAFPCFNGAALFQVRKDGLQKPERKRRQSFNGAALFQVRKAGGRERLLRERARASMGPHFFKCGKIT